jgi:hypothetical protein
MAGEPAAGRQSVLGAWTPTLLLLTPFVIFVRHHAYPVFSAEILACLALLGAAGACLYLVARRWPATSGPLTAAALIFFADVQFDITVPIEGVGESAVLLFAFVALAVLFSWAGQLVPVVGLMTATVLLTTLVMPGGQLVSRSSIDVAATDNGPLVLHLILDEHIGPVGLERAKQRDASRQLRTWLAERGFLIVESAYSETTETVQSVGHALNLVSGRHDHTLVDSAGAPFAARLTRSGYFEAMSRIGYELRIVQPDHLDLCSTGSPAASCETYASAKLGVLRDTALTPADRALVVAGAFLMRSDLWNEARELYNRLQVSRLSMLPAWTWERTRVSPIAATLALERLRTDLKSARRGQLYLAHLLLPHYPYVYDGSCRARPPSDWLDRNDTRFFPHRNSVEGRSRRYQQYVEQMNCTWKLVDGLLAAIPESAARDAIVIIHGDHGSRIALGGSESRASDDGDNYSTLFAIRAQGVAQGVDSRQSAVGCLLSSLVARRFEGLAADACSSPPAVWDPDDRASTRPLQVFVSDP